MKQVRVVVKIEEKLWELTEPKIQELGWSKEQLFNHLLQQFNKQWTEKRKNL